MDYDDTCELDCVLTNIQLQQCAADRFVLSKEERDRIQALLQNSLLEEASTEDDSG